MAKINGATFDCNNCGARVAKAISNAGKSYLASVVVVHNQYAETNQHGKMILPAHECDANEVKNYSKKIAMALEMGLIVKGQEVIVVKGRKVPKGTRGIVFWVKEEKINGEVSETRIGFKDSNETVYWIDAKNVAATNQYLNYVCECRTDFTCSPCATVIGVN